MKSSKFLAITGIVLSTTMILGSLLLLFLNRTNSIPEGTLSGHTNGYEVANIQDVDTTQEEATDEDTQEDTVTDQEQSEQKVNGESFAQQSNEQKEEMTLSESGWIPNWGFDLGYESLRNNEGIIDTVMPVLYSVDKNGNVVSRGVTETNIQKLLTYSNSMDIRVIPTVGSYDFDAMSAAFASEDSYRKQINTIISEVEKYDFDGIDLDYEMIRVSEKDNYLLFLEELSDELNRRDKILSVTVFAQWEDASYKDHEQTREVQDYTRIGQVADEVRIMAYDYTLQSSKTPGPIGPINWIRDVLDYATSTIGPEKVWLGVHLYGYQWSESRTVAFTYTTGQTIINSPNINAQFREDIGEGYAEFSCDEGQSCTAYFQNERGVQMRRDIAKEYGIAGVAYWRLGGELDILK